MPRRQWILDRLAELGLTQLACAKAADVSESTIERWIAGENTPPKGSPRRRGLAAALQMPLDTLDATFAAEQAAAAGKMTTVTLSSDGWSRTEAQALGGMMTGDLQVSTDSVQRAIHAWLVTPPPQQVELAKGRRIGESLIAKVERRVVQLRHLDDVIGGRDLLVLVQQELAATGQLLKQAAYGTRLGRRLLIAVGELCQLAGWVAADAGQNTQATRYLGTGIKAAHAGGDNALAANIISTLAYHLTNTGQRGDGILIAQSAIAGARNSSPVASALFKERLAWAYANTGQRKQTENMLFEVEKDYAHQRKGNEPDWVYWLSEDEINIMAARCFIQLNQAARGIPLLESIVQRYDPKCTRELALYTSWLSEAYLQIGEVEEAARHAIATVHLAIQTTSSRSDERVRALAKRGETYSSLREMQAFLRLLDDLRLRD